MGRPPRMLKPSAADMTEKWKSSDAGELAHEIATFHQGGFPNRCTRQVQISLEGAPKDCETLMDMTKLNPTLLAEMSHITRQLFLQTYLEDIQDLYSEVMKNLTFDNRVTFDSLQKFKHLTVSLAFAAVSEVCQEAFDHPATDFDEYPEVAPDTRPGCWCTLDVAKFTELTAASVALVKHILGTTADGLPDAVEEHVVHVQDKFLYGDI